MEQLSDIQSRIYAFIARTIQTEGLPPTNREIGRVLGLSSTGHVEHHLRMLEKKGWIIRVPGKGRGIKLPKTATGIPLQGTIAAGVPLDIFPDPPQFLPIAEQLFGTREGIYALQVRGESMVEDHICDGDYVVIQPQAIYQDGDVLVAAHLQEGENGSATLKRVFSGI
jgi:repressor LexA